MKAGYHWAMESKYVSVPQQDQLNMKSGHSTFEYSEQNTHMEPQLISAHRKSEHNQ